MEQTVAAGKIVGIYYTLKDASGRVLDTNRKGGKPMPYLHGRGNLLKGVEAALEGKAKNDFVEVKLAAADGYGVRRPELVQKVARGSFPAGRPLAAGMTLQRQDEQGRVRLARVLDVGDTEVTIDENHPLADLDLHFEITVCGVRDATPEEVQHGHAHGPGGHAH
ncbi:MAG: peptidylprolyl isomerase [Planctomycetaceae bacterium]|jgi:FKBP-type peptidyl-prolyl cis-trans isomerase SlyD|nr:peptidylprolyl isomerase [Planctomycetaceae bacterium]